MKYAYIFAGSLIFVLILFGSAEGQEHRYWDTQNKILIPSYLALSASDAAATERLWQSGPGWSESNPLIPGTRAGRVAYFAGTAAGVLSASYLAHKTGHHKLEKVILWIGNITEAQA